MTYNKYTCEVGHPDLRREFIGSSDASAIMQVSPWDTRLTLWETKLGLRPAKDISYAMAEGIKQEENARKYISDITGIQFYPDRIFSEKYPFMMANLDGMSECRQYSVEIKCPGIIDHSKAIAGIVPEKYIPQLQHQMIVSGHKIMYYLSYYRDNPVILKVEQDLDYQEKLIEAEKEFYQNLLTFTEPTKCDRDYVKRTDASWRDAAHKYTGLKKMCDELNEQLEEAKTNLLLMAQDKSTEGCGVKVIKSSRKGTVQYSKIPELQYIDLDYYRSCPVEHWKILTSGENDA
jgi:putative phage-type endonuclease